MSHIDIYGYPSFQAWVEAGMPGSVNSKTRQINGKTPRPGPDLRRGLCIVDDCESIVHRHAPMYGAQMCLRHYNLYYPARAS